jgi:hypothetical protein
MGTTTHRIAVGEDAYVNVSNGNLNCTIIKGDQPVRLIVGSTAEQTVADTRDYALVNEMNKITAENLEAEDDVWLRAEHGEIEVVVIRGPARIAFAPS